MGTTYTKKIKFEAVQDSDSFKSLSKTIDELGVSFGDKVKSDLKSINQIKSEIEALNKQLDSLSGLSGKNYDRLRKEIEAEIKSREKDLGVLGADNKENTKAQLQQLIFSKLESWSKSALQGLKTIFEDAWEELSNITNFSRLSNSNTRDLAFTYGFNSSQAYGYSQAMEMMGFQSEEDLMYATQEEIVRFKDMFSKYTTWYEGQGKEELQLYRDFEIELAEFKQDLKLTVVNFFMENKDDIKAMIKFTFEVGKFLMSSLGWLLHYFGGEKERSSSQRNVAVADAFANYSNSTSVTNNSFNNTFSVGTVDDAKSLYSNVLQVQQAFV